MGVIARYREFLPVGPKTPDVDLHEGSTPLVPSRNIGRALGLSKLYFKYEGLNPTGSFKDRGMVVAVAKALEAGSRVLMCASTGNTSASMAAYAARTGVRAIVVVPSGEIALNKLSQALMYGAKVVALKGNFDHALQTVRDLSSRYPVALMNSVNPHRIEGQKTAAFEVVEALGDAPDYLLVPVGNAGNITAYWKGFRESQAKGLAKHLPRMVGAQADGAAPIVNGHPVDNPRTIASAIRIGNPASWGLAKEALADSGGWIEAVTDEEIVRGYRMLAREEGIFMEPASCATVAGLAKMVKAGKFEPGSTLVLTLTGHGLKDPDTALESATRPVTVPARLDAVLAQLGL